MKKKHNNGQLTFEAKTLYSPMNRVNAARKKKEGHLLSPTNTLKLVDPHK